MNSKTVLGVIIGGVAGLTLAMGTMAFAINGGHMDGNTQASGMMGQTTQQTTNNLGNHGSMHGNTANQTTHGNGAHHANFGKTAAGTPCHSADTTVKG